MADMPVGVDYAETAMFFALQEAGLKVVDGQQIMLGAREIKNWDEIQLLNQAATHGRRRLPHDLGGAEAGRARERHRRDVEQDALRDGLGRRRGDQRDLGRALQPASAQLHRPLLPARRPGVLRHPAVLPGLPDLLLPHLQHRPRDAGAARRLRQGARMARRGDRGDQARGDHRQGGASSGRRPRNSASPTSCRPSGCSSATGWGWRCTSGRSSAARSASITRWRSRPAWSSRWKPIARPPTAIRLRGSRKRWW